jgi:hypothetical protein
VLVLQDITDVVTALPFRFGRCVIAAWGIDGLVGEFHFWNIAWAVIEDVLGCHTNESFCTRQVGDGLWALIEARSTRDPKSGVLRVGIEVHEQEAYGGALDEVA